MAEGNTKEMLQLGTSLCVFATAGRLRKEACEHNHLESIFSAPDKPYIVALVPFAQMTGELLTFYHWLVKSRAVWYV